MLSPNKAFSVLETNEWSVVCFEARGTLAARCFGFSYSIVALIESANMVSVVVCRFGDDTWVMESFRLTFELETALISSRPCITF